MMAFTYLPRHVLARRAISFQKAAVTMPCFATYLTDRHIIEIGGADALDFLQNLITADLAALSKGAASLAALLTPQGKILFDFIIVSLPDAGPQRFLIDIESQGATALLQRLSMYKLRADVSLTDRSDGMMVVALYRADETHSQTSMTTPVGDNLVVADPRHTALGHRAYLPKGSVLTDEGLTIAEMETFHAHRIACAIPEASLDYEWGDHFPHDANFDQMGAIGFQKGCFVGQEVVSRMKHRGTARRRIVQVQSTAALPANGTPILADGKLVGTIRSTNEVMGLAAVRIDKVAAAHTADIPLLANGLVVKLVLPDWVDFGWGA